jgi:hypothetical protein
VKISYCYQCNVRIDWAAAVTTDGRTFCSDCAVKITAPATASSGISTRFRVTVRKAFFSRIEPTDSQRLFLGSATLPAQKPGFMSTLMVHRCKIACGIIAAALLAAAAFCAADFSPARPATLIEAAEIHSQPPVAVTEDAKVPITILHQSIESAARAKCIAQ